MTDYCLANWLKTLFSLPTIQSLSLETLCNEDLEQNILYSNLSFFDHILVCALTFILMLFCVILCLFSFLIILRFFLPLIHFGVDIFVFAFILLLCFYVFSVWSVFSTDTDTHTQSETCVSPVGLPSGRVSIIKGRVHGRLMAHICWELIVKVRVNLGFKKTKQNSFITSQRQTTYSKCSSKSLFRMQPVRFMVLPSTLLFFFIVLSLYLMLFSWGSG